MLVPSKTKPTKTNNMSEINKTYKIDIADRNKGHNTVANLTLDEATETIISNADNNARWVFINGEKFEFNGGSYRSEQNVQKLRTAIEQLQDPAILLTGVLVGGNE